MTKDKEERLLKRFGENNNNFAFCGGVEDVKLIVFLLGLSPFFASPSHPKKCLKFIGHDETSARLIFQFPSKKPNMPLFRKYFTTLDTDGFIILEETQYSDSFSSADVHQEQDIHLDLSC